MATLEALGTENFAVWPVSPWTYETDTEPGVTPADLSGGIEGLTVALHDNGQFAFVYTTTSYDGLGCRLTYTLPSSVPDGVQYRAGISTDSSARHTPFYAWQRDAGNTGWHVLTPDGVGASLSVSPIPKKVRLSFNPTSCVYSYQDDTETWIDFHTETTSETWVAINPVIDLQASADNVTTGVVTVNGESQVDPEALPLTLGNARDLFRQWLDTVDYTQPQSSAVLTYQQVQAQTTGYAGTYGTYVLSSDTLKGAIAGILGLLSSIFTIAGFLRDLFPTGHTPSDHDASLEAHRAATEPEGETLPSYIEGEIEIVLSAVTDQTNEITQILAHGNGTEDVPTIVGESDWGNVFRFDVPADFYTVDITTTDLDATAEDVAGTQVWDHLGFCIPLTVDGLPEYGPRLAIGSQVIRTGRQMGGIILNGRRVLSGHVTAYQYQPA